MRSTQDSSVDIIRIVEPQGVNGLRKLRTTVYDISGRENLSKKPMVELLRLRVTKKAKIFHAKSQTSLRKGDKIIFLESPAPSPVPIV